jgi:hypothetical protein
MRKGEGGGRRSKGHLGAAAWQNCLVHVPSARVRKGLEGGGGGKNDLKSRGVGAKAGGGD